MKTLLVILGYLVLLSGCMNEYKFNTKNAEESPTTPSPNEIARNPADNTDVGSPKPIDPNTDPVVDPDHPTPSIVTYKKGECTKDPLAVLSCLNCQISQKAIEVPLSGKAAQLLKIMQAGCAILNKSDPKDYKPPTHEQILRFLNRANAVNYPETSMTARQQVNFGKWLASEPESLKQLFGGLWYHPPYSDDFETYFGLEAREARYFFCYNDPESSFSQNSVSEIHSFNYLQCIQNLDSSHCFESKAYALANLYRVQLVDSISKSIDDPFNEQELVPANKCHWQSMSGKYNLEMENKLIEWKNLGYALGVYFETDHPYCQSLNAASIPISAQVTIAGKLCTDL